MTKISQEDRTHFVKILDEKRVLLEREKRAEYGKDETEDLEFLPDIILLPESTKEVSQIMQYCHERGITVTPRAAGTGLSGGALPVHGGVSLSMERMNHILSIDTENFTVSCEPGVITEVLQNAVAEMGLFYPPDPASKGSCFIGGNVAENSGGPKAVKYGVVQDYVLNLELVLPTGKVIETGAEVRKNATGYNLTQLVVGSEGTLGIISRIVLKLIPHPTESVLMLAPFNSAIHACEMVSKIMAGGIVPSGLEFMERDALELAMKYTIEKPALPMGEEVKAHLIIELDGMYADQLMEEAEEIYSLLESEGVEDVLFAETEAQKEQIWSLRRSVGEAVKRHSIYKEEDTVVPRKKLPALLAEVKELGKEYGFRSVCYGHAGDGNLHINILKEEMEDEKWHKILPVAIRKLFEKVKKMGGTISGEHGIGYVQKEYLPIVFGEEEMALLKGIKKLFDPKGILNPGKIFPEN